MAGNGTIGLEILEDLPDPDAVVIPYGGGGLTVGIASAIKALRPGTKIFTPSPTTAAALAAALAAGEPADVDYEPSFVDGSGSRRVLDSMWPLVAPLVDDAFAVPVAEAAAAVRMLAERVRVIAEGAGALAPAAALAGRAGTGKIVCIVSGGNINLAKLAEILAGGNGDRRPRSPRRCSPAPAPATTSATCEPTSCCRCRRPRRSASITTSCCSRPSTSPRSCG